MVLPTQESLIVPPVSASNAATLKRPINALSASVYTGEVQVTVAFPGPGTTLSMVGAGARRCVVNGTPTVVDLFTVAELAVTVTKYVVSGNRFSNVHVVAELSAVHVLAPVVSP